MSNILKRLQRDPKFQKQEQPPAPAPADTNGLGVAIQQLIDQAVQTQVADAVEKQKPAHNPRVPAHLRDFTSEPLSSEFPPPAPMAKQQKDFTMNVQRDELGRIKTFTVGSDAKFELQRNGEGKTVRVVKLD